MGDNYAGINSNRIDAYRARLPSPPHLLMDGWPGAELDECNLDLIPSYLNATEIREFFNVAAAEQQINWKYDQRRECQQILPFLSLGPLSAIKDSSVLQNNQITMLIALVHVPNSTATKSTPVAARNALEVGITTHVLHTSNDQQLIRVFPTAVEAINEHMKSNPDRKIVVACETGNDRSACVVVAYLISLFGLDTVQAIQVVTCRRFCCAITDDRKSILEAWNDLQKAQRDTGGVGFANDANLLQADHSLSNTRKRSRQRLVDEDDDDIDMDDMSARREFTPFYE